MKNKTFADVMVTGFALFAMFFGAGNLIFPPYLGWSSASNWVLGFISFIIVDIGLSILAILVLAKIGKGSQGVTENLGRVFSAILICTNTICLGPLIAIPRTAATTFEFGIVPTFPNLPSWIFSVFFFIIVVILSIKQTRAVDIIGAVLAPIMLISLLLLIIVGIVSPLGIAEGSVPLSSVIKDGIKSGYQTMDMMGAMILSLAVTVSIKNKGYTTKPQQYKMIALSGLVSSIALFSVYGGLAYLGATVSSVFPPTLSQSELLIAITSGLLGKSGVILLGIIVSVACLTTAIGLLSSVATFFEEFSNGRLSYKAIVIFFAVISCIISNFGISTIIAFASPILDLIYPILVVLIVLGIFYGHIENPNVHRMASFGALLTAILGLIQSITGVNTYVSFLPLYDYGFPWVAPAILFGIIGAFIPMKKAAIRPHKNTPTL